MKKIIYIWLAILLLGCDSENAFDCFKKEGTIIQKEFTISPFTEIIVFERVQLFIEEGPDQKVIVETGENLLGDIEVKVENGTLSLIENTRCNLIRDYGVTKVFVTVPNIEQIRNSSGLSVKSVGVLRFPKLVLLSEEQVDENEFHTDGDFILNLEVEELIVLANGLSNFYLTGSAEKASISLYAGDSRVEAANFIINELVIYHRSTNKMIVNPQESIIGQIRSLGDVISKNRPPIVDVKEYYTGKLIFED